MCASVFRQIPFDVFLDMAKVCKENGLEKESLPQWAKKVIGRIWSQVLERREGAKVSFTKSIIGGSRTSRRKRRQHFHLCL